jgi:phospholipase B1
MARLFLLSLSCVCLSFVASLQEYIHEEFHPPAGQEESWTAKRLRTTYTIQNNPILREDMRRRLEEAEQFNLTMPPIIFDCDFSLTSPEVPTSIHRLRPGDIKVLGAFGDSISSGNGLGADNQPEVAIENRGEVFTIGGDASLDYGVVTLTNFFRKFNRDVKGYSVCASTRDNLAKSWLNVAEPGGVCTDMPPQAAMFAERLRNDSRIDMENDWKMVSLFVGGNDLCASCRRESYWPVNYGKRFREAVDILYNEVPRLFVNLVVMFDVTPLVNFTTGPVCRYLQENYCDCCVNETTRRELRNTQLGYYNELVAIAEDPKYQDRDDFQVVVQPQMRDLMPPIDPETGKYIPGFLAPDCFHPNRVMHQAMAYFLWNAILTPVGQKPLDSELVITDDPVPAICPTEKHPYIFTNFNSDVEWP